MSGKIFLFSIVPTLLPWLRVEDANFPNMSLHKIKDEVLFQLYLSLRYSQQSIARKKSSDGKIEYIMASMLIVLLDVW